MESINTNYNIYNRKRKETNLKIKSSTDSVRLTAQLSNKGENPKTQSRQISNQHIINMKHKTSIYTVCSALISIVLYQVYNSLHSEGMSKEEFYLQENIEALSDAENSSETAKCGTKEEYIEGYPCPVHPYRMIGFRGTEYSYAPIGLSNRFKTGKKGYNYSCVQMGESPLPVDEIKEYSCSSKK